MGLLNSLRSILFSPSPSLVDANAQQCKQEPSAPTNRASSEQVLSVTASDASPSSASGVSETPGREALRAARVANDEIEPAVAQYFDLYPDHVTVLKRIRDRSVFRDSSATRTTPRSTCSAAVSQRQNNN